MVLISDWLAKSSKSPKEPLGPAAEGAGEDDAQATPSLAMDCRRYGNVGRFVRCADAGRGEVPNLVCRAVFTDNRHIPRLALFAAADLPPGTELMR